MNFLRVLGSVFCVSLFVVNSYASGNKFEAKIAYGSSEQYGYQKLRTKFYMEKDRKAANVKSLKAFGKTAKDQGVSANCTLLSLSHLFKIKNRAEAVAMLKDFDKKYPDMISLQVKAKGYLFRLLRYKDVNAELKYQVFNELTGRMKNGASALGGVRHYISTLDKTPKEKYTIASEWAFDSGKSFLSSNFLSGFLQKIAWQNPDHEYIITQCDKIIDFYGKDSINYIDVLKIKLKHQADSGDKDAKQKFRDIAVKEKRETGEVKDIYSAMEKLSADKKYDKCIAEMGKLKKYPLYLLDRHSGNAFQKSFAAMPAKDKFKFFNAAIDILPECRTANELYHRLLQDKDVKMPFNAEHLLISAEKFYKKDSVLDIFKVSATPYFLTQVVNKKDVAKDIKLKVFTIASDYSLRAGINDKAAEYLFKKGKLEIDGNKKGAIKDFEKIIKILPKSHIAMKAKWLLELLKNKSGLVQGALPRSERFFNKAVPDFIFASSKSPSPSSSTVVVDSSKKIYSLKENNPSTNVVDATQVVASSNNANAKFAVDGEKGTTWVPDTIPSAILFPLNKISTINKIVIKTADKLWYYVDLLDSNKKTLRRYERAWVVWENLNSDTYWPKENITLSIIPTDNVAFIKLVVLGKSTADAGVMNFQAFESKFPAKTIYKLKSEKIAKSAKSINVSWEKIEPEHKVEYTPEMECVRGFPIMRWIKPWMRRRSPLLLRTVGYNLGVKFSGANADMLLTHVGGLEWSLDLKTTGSLDKQATPPKKEVPFADLASNSHLLLLKARAFPAKNDTFGQNNIGFAKLKVKGISRADMLIRFKTSSGKKWSSWNVLTSQKLVHIPNRSKEYQLAVSFDTSATLANISPTLSNVAVTFPNQKSTTSLKKFSEKVPSFINKDLTAVVKAIADRKVVIVFSKTGTEAEYNIAKKIAKKAGLYLVSDDLGLNNYPGPALAIGTPLRNRYCRQLISRYFVWDDENFINNPNGYIGKALNAEDKTDYYYVTAHTPAGVIKAAERLLAKIADYKAPTKPFRLFNASTIEVIYPWQMNTDKKTPKTLKVEMAENDRRSIQMGINFNHKVDNISVECSELVNEKGAKLATPRVRFVGFYEFFPFFGNLRLPDLLVDKPILPVPANTSTGVWITFETGSKAQSGTYKGSITVKSGKYSKSIPVAINVLPFALPDINRIDTYSYSSVPYWFTLGSDNYKAAFEKLCKNEAEHSISIKGIKTDYTCTGSLNKDGKKILTFKFPFVKWQINKADEIYKKMGKSLPLFQGRMPKGLMQVAIQNGIPKNKINDFVRSFASQLTAFLKKMGYYERFYLKVGDEPRDMTSWTKLAKPYKEGGLKITTAHATRYKDMELATGIMDAFCPNYQHNVFIPYLQERKKAGDKVWWYCCGAPMTRITGQAVDNLPFYWLTAKWNFDGAHSYAGLEPKESGSEGNDIPLRYDHGLSFRIMFLPDGSLIDTTRRELESEGIKDCLLIYKIKDNIAKLAKDGKQSMADDYSKKLNAILESVVPYKYGYAQTAKEWEQARHKLYQLIK